MKEERGDLGSREEAALTFSFVMKSSKKRKKLEDSNENSPSLKKVKSSEVEEEFENENTAQDEQGEELNFEQVDPSAQPVSKLVNGNKKKLNSSMETNEETIQRIEIQISEEEWKRTIDKHVQATMQPINRSIQDLEEHVKETRRNLWFISVPLWILVILILLLIGIEYSKFINPTISVKDQPGAVTYNNSTTIIVNSTEDVTKEKKVSLVPIPDPVETFTIQYISDNVKFIENSYLEEKFKHSKILSNMKNIKFTFQAIDSVDQFNSKDKNSFFLLFYQSNRFTPEERPVLIEKYLKHVDAKRSATIFVCMMDRLKLAHTELGDVFSVEWYKNPEERNEKDEKTIDELIKKIVQKR